MLISCSRRSLDASVDARKSSRRDFDGLEGANQRSRDIIDEPLLRIEAIGIV